MGERRLKRFLILLVLFSIFLVARALHIQVLQASHWAGRAEGMMQKVTYTDTVRGRILDLHGRELATDEPCIDVAVDYRAVTTLAEEKWCREQAISRLRAKPNAPLKGKNRDQREELIKAEMAAVQQDINSMFERFAEIHLRQENGKSNIETAREYVEDIRQSIEQKIELRQDTISHAKYTQAMKNYAGNDSLPWYKRILRVGAQPEMNDFQMVVAEQTHPHVILRGIDPETYNDLAKNVAKYPGLVLQSSKRRIYPQHNAGCHFIGYLSRVSANDFAKPDFLKRSDDPLRGYWSSDLIGRSGLEGMCEETLRGWRGQTTLAIGDEQVRQVLPVNGKDVNCSVDIELQLKLQKMFLNTPVSKPIPDGHKTERIFRKMHGAIVVIDIPTGEVRALASYPDFDLDKLADEYPQLSKDDYNQPLRNRATQQALEPGSTVKPLVGIGAITSGAVGLHERIECTGHLLIDGRRSVSAPRCWVVSMFGDILAQAKMSPNNHPIPDDDPCREHGLDLSEAIKRSCNIYFETAAERMGFEALTHYYDQFGLGRKTGIGIEEVAGLQPATRANTYTPAQTNVKKWYGAIGQGDALATPLQMCNVAATIARGGVWMRPSLLQMPHRPASDIVKLDLSSDAIRAAQSGMRRVVSERAGSGNADLNIDGLAVAAKSGSAQASWFKVPERDENGKIIRRWPVDPSTFDNPNPLAPWFLMTGHSAKELTHSWFIGYAPADNPKIAFAVLVEYGGGGAGSAAPMARQVLEACIDHGYLSRSTK